MRERPSFNPESQGNFNDQEIDKPADQPKKVDRRAFLKGLGALGVAAASSAASESLVHAFISETENSADLKKVTGEADYETGPLAGRAFGDLYSDYTGIKGKVPKTAKINFSQQLRALYARKEAFVKRQKG